jgi:hypothetical protein
MQPIIASHLSFKFPIMKQILFITASLLLVSRSAAFSVGNPHYVARGRLGTSDRCLRCSFVLSAAATKVSNDDNELLRVPPNMDGVEIPFLDNDGKSFIECYADSVCKVQGVEYTVGVPCDTAVSICYYDAGGELVPIELDEELMDDVFSVAESIVADGTFL